jgi:hypothetical protein
MRFTVLASAGVVALASAGVGGCASNPEGFSPMGSASGSGSGSGGSRSSSGSSGGAGASSGASSGASTFGHDDAGANPDPGTATSKVYAHTDDTLYSIDPATKAATLIGMFVGTSGASSDSAVTDLAVDSTDTVYVNTESVVYRATLPASSTGPVQLTRIASIQGGGRFYALAFAPTGALDPNAEALVGGDSSGSLWAISTSTGALIALGNFGPDQSIPGNTFELSGDVVFYDDPTTRAPTGLATIRSCPPGGSGSKCKGDYLASVNMTALKNAYTSQTAAASLLGGIYGGSASAPGSGTGFADVFGLAAWDSTVFGFSRHTGTIAPTLITIDTTSGAGSMIANSFPFTNGWSGAGVTTKVTISVPPPPPLQ